MWIRIRKDREFFPGSGTRIICHGSGSVCPSFKGLISFTKLSKKGIFNKRITERKQKGHCSLSLRYSTFKIFDKFFLTILKMFNKSRVGSGIGSGTLKSCRRIRIRNKITLDPQHWPKPQKETVKKTQIPTTVACKPNFMQVSTWSILHLLPGRSCPVVRHP